MKLKKVIFWILAVVISLAAMVYQKLTGPTYPKEYKFARNGSEYSISLPRSHGGETDCPVEMELTRDFEGKIIWRRFPTEEPWDTQKMWSSGLRAMSPPGP
jgi:hypothetical protein